MEHLVPDSVSYTDFWTRYYFLRNELDVEEQRRKALLKNTIDGGEEEVAWDENSDSDSSSEEESDSDSDAEVAAKVKKPEENKDGKEGKEVKSTETLLPKEKQKKGGDRASQPDSEESYDLVSGATSNVPSTPGTPPGKGKKVDAGEESEEDWE